MHRNIYICHIMQNACRTWMHYGQIHLHNMETYILHFSINFNILILSTELFPISNTVYSTSLKCSDWTSLYQFNYENPLQDTVFPVHINMSCWQNMYCIICCFGLFYWFAKSIYLKLIWLLDVTIQTLKFKTTAFKRLCFPFQKWSGSVFSLL